MMYKFEILLLILFQAAKQINQMPISVPVENYPDSTGRFHPNAFFNRLPGNRVQVNQYPIQTDPISNNNVNSVTDEYEDYEEETSNRPTNGYYSSNSNYNNNPILTENYIKHKKKRRKKIRRPCIPIQSFNSGLFSGKRIKREEKKESGKTFGLFGGFPFSYPPPIGTPFYGNYYGGGYPNRPYYDNVRPQYDNNRPQYDNNRPQYDYNRPQYDNNRPQYDNNRPQYDNSPLYNPIGGYPCVPVSYGHVPFGGPFGFFGPGGLFDTGASPSLSIPQTVIVNRPPLFGNRPSYEQGGSGVSSDGRPPSFLTAVVDKLSEFVTSVSPQAVYSAIGDTLQSFGGAIQNSQQATSAVDSIRNGYREFSSLIFR